MTRALQHPRMRQNNNQRGMQQMNYGNVAANPPRAVATHTSASSAIKLADAIAELKAIKDEEWEEILPVCCQLLKEHIASHSPSTGLTVFVPAPNGASTASSSTNSTSEESGPAKGPLTPTYSEPSVGESSSDNASIESQLSSPDEALPQPSAPSSEGSNSPSNTSPSQNCAAPPSGGAKDEVKEGHVIFEEASIGLSSKASLKIFIPIAQHPGVSPPSRSTHSRSCNSAQPSHSSPIVIEIWLLAVGHVACLAVDIRACIHACCQQTQ